MWKVWTVRGQNIAFTMKSDEPSKMASHSNWSAAPQRTLMRRFCSRCWSCLVIFLVIVFGLQLGSFVRYVGLVTRPAVPLTHQSDGIVILTGGQNRLESAIYLLNKADGRRLLITGVNASLSDQNLKKIMPIRASLFQCCVDIDKSALNTIGNALATKDWVRARNIRSLIVVTGAFHMPRALKELRHALGDIELTAYPVNVPQGHNWWRDHSRLRDLLREYMKLMAVSLRDYLNRWSNRAWPYMPFYKKASIEVKSGIKQGSL